MLAPWKNKLWPTSILESRDITLPTKLCIDKAMVFPVVMYGYELDHKEGQAPKNWCFQRVSWKRLFRLYWTLRRSNLSVLKVNNPEYSLEGLRWSWSSNTLATQCREQTLWKRPWFWRILRAGGKGDNRGWDAWMASLTQWTWVWANSRKWWRTG